MNLQVTIKEEIKEAMKEKNKPRLEALRSVSTACMNELVKLGHKPQEELPDEEVLGVIARLVKQRKDSIAQFKNAGREDLVLEEESQIVYIEKFLPELMSREEIYAIVVSKKEELGVTDASKKGLLMSAIMKDVKGRADGLLVKEIVEELST